MLLRARLLGSQGRRGPSRLDDAVSLERFLQRARVLSLYRTILRGTGRIGDARARAETRHFVRAEFERDRALQDMNHIRYLLSTAKTEWERMEKYIGPT